ncbi:hypothetical protein [Gilvimarinus sp. DA14]|uniref:hypothetical protein n=1 Tax=Gilvimarinus sp. DA14 TaxID=2956798 RepID=UPI0020B7644A|nr:hypothetical protein [Gilvimarinus sp. DA14]UTF58854.1 hypothetical protein NHM04_10210 [Gilvimarinus sp. DA14]
MRHLALFSVCVLAMCSGAAQAYPPPWPGDAVGLLEVEVWRGAGNLDWRNLGLEWLSLLQQWLGQLLSQVSFNHSSVELPTTAWRASADVILLRGALLSLVFSGGILVLAITEVCKP